MSFQLLANQPSEGLLDADRSSIQRLLLAGSNAKQSEFVEASDTVPDNQLLNDLILIGRISYRLLLASAALLILGKELFGKGMF